MKLKYDALSYVMEKGKPHHKMRVLLAFDNKREVEKFLMDFKESQNPDGGWSWLGWWPFDEPRPSSTYDTAEILYLLLKAGVDRSSETVEKAVNFLFTKQRSDGGWSESPEISKAIKKEWVWYSTNFSITWITASIVNVLVDAAHGTDERIKKAMNFLRRMQNEEGGWPSHEEAPQRTDMWTMEAIIKAFIKTGEPKDSPVIKKALKAIIKYRKKWKEPAENPLGVFMALGYEPDHVYVQECLNYLIAYQHEDGGWGYYNDWPSHPDQASSWIPCLLELKVKVNCS
jgi:squalene cyclase